MTKVISWVSSPGAVALFCLERLIVPVICLVAIRWRSCSDNNDSDPVIHLDSALQFTRDFKYVTSSNYHNNTLRQVLIYPNYSRGSKYSMVKNLLRASLVAQWLRVCLLMQETRVRALLWEDPTCRGATKPVRHNY